MQRTLLIITLAGFSVLTALALWQHGYWGLFAPAFQSYGAAQVLADLVIALVIILTWLWGNARATGRNPVPWVLLTLVAGSFGPLLYLLSQPGAQVARHRAH